MENAFLNEHKDEDSINTLTDGMKIEEDDGSVFSECKSKSQVNKVYPEYTLAMNVQKSQTSENFIKHLYQYTTTNKIPKHIVSVDERYLRWCLEMIHISAAKSATCNVHLNSSLTRIGTLLESTLSPGLESMDLSDSARFFIKCSLLAGSGDAVTGPPGHWSVGSTNGTKGITSVLRIPLFQQLGASENPVDLSGTVMGESRPSIGSNYVTSSGGLSIYSPQKLGKQRQLALNQYELDVMRDSLSSMSNLNSVFQDQSSAASVTISHGMLRSRWSGGIPQFVFSVDGKRETYVAEIVKSEAPDDKSQSWTYLFYLKTGNLKEPEIYGRSPDPVGKMKVSTSVKLCPDNSRFMESEFILFGDTGSNTPDMQTLTQSPARNKLSKKVVRIFKPSQSSKHRTNSSIWETSSSLDYCPWEPTPDAQKSFDVQARFNLLENELPPNFELAAIVIREQLPMNRQESEVGGWGLKFLKKAGRSNTSIPQEAPPPAGHRPESAEDCCTSTSILIPAGCHGGPRNRTNGPSSLIKRWRSGGHCDCGGWDIGCPIKVLNVRSDDDEVLLQTNEHWELKSYDLFIQGTKGSAPTLKVVNIRNGLHYIDFESTLSALQAFAVTVAILHNQNPSLRPRDV